jgi:hypothetical protein
MAQPVFGPIYCETLHFVPGVFPAEPVNTISNVVIVAFGVAAAYFVAKRAPRAYDLYCLSGLLIVNGIGSALWHGLRTPWALTFDVMPGLVFLFMFLFFWARRLWSRSGAALFLIAFFAAAYVSSRYWGVVQRWVALAPVVVAAALVLIAETYRRSRSLALAGGAALASALLALFFRSIDLDACAYIPVGTHFLWHIFLSAAGFIGIMALIRFRPRRSAPEAAQ